MELTELEEIFKGKEGCPIEVKHTNEEEFLQGIYYGRKEECFTVAWRENNKLIVGVNAQLDDGFSIVNVENDNIYVQYYVQRGGLHLTPKVNNNRKLLTASAIKLLEEKYIELDTMFKKHSR
ncbi:hypothetical protein HQ529_06390 [Candidatus Woesearchaeota archaeon]|nr:hypothetical protein [Candidatus Woesearchaeota archaeon]